MTKYEALIKVPSGWHALNAGEKIRSGDRFGEYNAGSQSITFGDCFSSVGSLFQKEDRGFIDSVNRQWLVIRENEVKPQAVTPKFNNEEEVFIKNETYARSLNMHGVVGKILRAVEPSINYPGEYRYEVMFTTNNYHTIIILCDTFMDRVNKIAGHTVEVKPGGLQIGCTFVSDEDIRKAAKLRNIV